ncbi:MAG TPA: glycosyltransferase [Candidatus Krumholzibacteria bacterium]|nr:glycosyltransferase [Candidatus Krumholzibacteria bacterium]HPD72732.1 glycosyltransferase [Candidatus Krumholzibacteria bacterium]HRY40336.1 glycosyltransferase [Candidatus Krumholzibacteria bacterium]
MTDRVESALPAGVRVALVHDWLVGMRGGEKVFEVFCDLLPAADVYTLLHRRGAVSPTIERHRITTAGRIQRLPAAMRVYRWALPLMPGAIESFDLAGYDLVLSSSHCVAKGARAAGGALHVCYCHTPMRYMWDRFDDYFAAKAWPVRLAAGLLRGPLQSWDRRTAAGVHRWLANSTAVRERIRACYGVPGERVAVIHPPVDAERFGPAAPAPAGALAEGGYDLVVSALVPYKRIDLAILAAVEAGRHLVVAGDGDEARRLRRLARDARGRGRVTFLGPVGDAELPPLYAHARCFVFPGLEDFGITPLEAMASGTPVVAFRAGGALDTVRDQATGIFFDEQTVPALAAALADPRLDRPWDRDALRRHAGSFGHARFRREIAAALADSWRDRAGTAVAHA